MTGSHAHSALERAATLRDPATEDPTVAEYQPAGTRA